jgi:cytochrome c peroxidase
MVRTTSGFLLKHFVAAGWAAVLWVALIAALRQSTTPARAKEIGQQDVPSSERASIGLGRALFFDTELSNPPGQSCGSCHSPSAGWRFPDSKTNERLGVPTGAIPGRVEFRAVLPVAYAAFIPTGPPTYDFFMGSFVGGLFWDGRATDLTDQIHFPLENPNEMNNLAYGELDAADIARKVRYGRYAEKFKSVYGPTSLEEPPEGVLRDITKSITDYENSPEVSPFSSKYDAYVQGRVKLSDEEMAGLRLVTGSTNGRPGGPANYKFAQCVLCHGIPTDTRQGPDLWTNSCYANIGVPRNRNNPFYTQTDSSTDPLGYNPEGKDFVDLGSGDSLYPRLGLPPGNMGEGNNGQGDYYAINGTFKAPTLRNVDARPSDDFIKAYMHNGCFKSLKDVVHFYNTRNLTTVKGEVIDFTQDDPYAGLRGKPIWPEPEYPSRDTLQNPDGQPASSQAQVGNLGLTDEEEDEIVAFLKTLTDGFFRP